jgi:hypothetical protein
MRSAKNKAATQDPSTPTEWQEAVNIAHAYRALEDCKMYGQPPRDRVGSRSAAQSRFDTA